MKLIELTVNEFVTEVASNSPAPGGGSVSALASSMGSGLVRMVGALSVNKKKFKALDEKVQTSFNDTIFSIQAVNKELINLIDKDTDAFNLIMKAFKLPKETEEEKSFRKSKIEEATNIAIEVPMQVAELSLLTLQSIIEVLPYINKNTLSDIGVAALMLFAGLEGAILNVKINVPGLSNEVEQNAYLKKAHHLYDDGTSMKNKILSIIHNKL